MSKIYTPQWVREAVFYQIFPDRFARSNSELFSLTANLQSWGAQPTLNGFHGGNLLGIIEKFDYLVDLGINAIYLNPIFQSASNHRYHTHDYYQIDPLLGNIKIFRTFLDEAHKRGIRVILDGVFNHASRGFFPFNHILECGAESPYIDWFHVRKFPLHAYDSHKRPNYKAWHNIKALPKFNTDNPQVRNFIFDVAKYWTSLGIDGWRLDVPDEIDDDTFWQEFRLVVKKINPESYIVGEIWVDEIDRTARRWLKGDQFDAVMNYGFTKACLGFFISHDLDWKLLKNKSLAPDKVLTAVEFSQRINKMLKNYAPEIIFAQFNIIDSHDTARYLSLARGKIDILKLTSIFQMTYPGSPCIYYGTEIGMKGGHDPYCRGAMPWEVSSWDNDLLVHYKKLIALRKAHPALTRGDYISLFADSSSGIYSFMRRGKQEEIVVILNNSDSQWSVKIPVNEYISDSVQLNCLLSKNSYTVKEGHIEGPDLNPRQGAILLVQRSENIK